jgi:DNA-binding transcriptional ArsR family regulator
MEKNFLIQLTNDLYRLTLFFPKKEPLRYKMRELANEILILLLNSSNPLKKDLLLVISKLEILDSFFEIARYQNWVRVVDLFNLQKKYQDLKIKIENSLLAKSKIKEENIFPKERKEKIETSAEIRQGKILEVLREKGRVQVWEIKEIFPQVSKRTLRRDFESLLKKGMVERVGERNTTFYRLKI